MLAFSANFAVLKAKVSSNSNNFSPTLSTVKSKAMKQYIGIKLVMAEPMTAQVAKEKGYRVENNTGEGYEVTYEDGYKSWCPKHVFEKSNHEVKNDDLAKSAIGMVSDNYKERFFAEYMQVKTRYMALVKMCHRWDAGCLEFTPTCPRATYNFQLKAMKEYMDILEIRAKIEGIEL